SPLAAASVSLQCMFLSSFSYSSVVFTDTASTDSYTLSLHDALPIFSWPGATVTVAFLRSRVRPTSRPLRRSFPRTQEVFTLRTRSEEHTSELQSRENLVCRLLLEKKKK